VSNKQLIPVQSAEVNPKIEFRDGQFLFSMPTGDGGLIEQFRSDAAIREAFSGIPVDSGWIRPEICRWGDGRVGPWAVAFFPPSRYTLEITNDGSGQPFAVEHVNVPLPGLIFFGIGVQYFVWATRAEKLEPHHEVYRCPLPNVMQDASVCWGLLKPPRATARTIFEAWDIFVSATFNNHAANGKSKSQREDVRVLLKELATAGDEARYPVMDLVRQVDMTGVTLEQAVRRFFDTGKMPG
jgi:hypothetical protein